MGGMIAKPKDRDLGILELRFLHTLKWGDVKMVNAYPSHFKGRFPQDDWFRISHQLEDRVNAYECDEKRLYVRFLKYLVVSCVIMLLSVAPAIYMTFIGSTEGDNALFAMGILFSVCFFVGTVTMVSVSQCLMPAAVQGWVRGVYTEVEKMLPELEAKYPTVALDAPVKTTDIGTPDLSVCVVYVRLLDGSPKVHVHGSVSVYHKQMLGSSVSNFYASSASISSRGGSSVELMKANTGSVGGSQSSRNVLERQGSRKPNLLDHQGQHYGGGSMHVIGTTPRRQTAPRAGGSLRDTRTSNGVQQHMCVFVIVGVDFFFSFLASRSVFVFSI